MGVTGPAHTTNFTGNSIGGDAGLQSGLQGQKPSEHFDAAALLAAIAQMTPEERETFRRMLG
jgi:hypothetical protein